MLRSASIAGGEGVCALLDRLAARFAPSNTPDHLRTGEDGELAAFFYLRRLGYVVVARRWRSPRRAGDIDLIAWEGDTLCFIEVKTRSSRRVATAEASVDHHKQQTLCRMARQYLRYAPAPAAVRFDVISVYFEAGHAPQYELIRSAFPWC